MTAREAVLARLRSAQRTARLPAVDRGAAPERKSYPAEACLERFLRELEALGVEALVASSPEEVRGLVRARIEGRRFSSWDPSLLPYEMAGVAADPVLGSHPREAQAAAEVGLTGCDAAVAETGSLVLVSGPGKSRAISLLPPVHVAVVRREQIVFSMAEFLHAHGGSLAAAASCTFVTGPSRTADIELTLTLGVHGPGKVVVVVGP